ncbi:hypothetical protein ELY33_00975 [Vreelandella andesensis]|uniref:Uncharacterized protein n=1 Tax=Vreelandella andesensis TaxID=447567 RepID=A0A3S0YB38_9GAMM|nr:hypothetical protein [Halomonas andesensis]RUR34783.1 hypothetical protein ELY33_00975 [Halomonas andesensis]
MPNRQRNWLESLIDKAQRFWPLSLLLMALTLLTKFESLQVWSEGLAFVVDRWRELMRLFWEFLVNFIRSLFKLPKLHIEHPIPEVLTFTSLFFTSIRAKSVTKHYLISFLEKICAHTTHEDFIYLILSFISVMLSIVAIGILFSNMDISILIFTFMLIGSKLLERFVNKSGSRNVVAYVRFFSFVEYLVTFWFITAGIVILGCALFVVAVFLELLVEYLGIIFTQFENFEQNKM